MSSSKICNLKKNHLFLDQDYGWSDGAEGTGKCYMLIKNFDYRFTVTQQWANIHHQHHHYTHLCCHPNNCLYLALATLTEGWEVMG